MPTPRCWPSLATDPDDARGDWRLYLLWPVVLAVGLLNVALDRVYAVTVRANEFALRLGGRAVPTPEPSPAVRWRLAIGPGGAASVVSDRTPGPVVGVGDLRRWFYAGKWSEDFEAVLAACRAHNAPRTRDPLAFEETLDHLMVKNAELMRRLA